MIKKKRKTSTVIVNHFMTRSDHGLLAQLFVMYALRKYADEIIATTPENYPANSFVDPKSWIGCAKEFNSLCNQEEPRHDSV